MDVLLFAVVLQVLAGTAALVVSKWPRAATVLGAGGAALGCLVGLAPTLRVLLGGAPTAMRLGWDAAHGAFCVEVDALGAFFLLPVLGLSALAAVYGADYLFASRHEKALGSPWFFFNVFIAGMVLVVVARTALLFLVAWEVMSLAAYFLVTFEHEKGAVRQAGWVYLIATHLGVAFLFLAFVLLGRSAGSLEFEAFRAMPALGGGLSGLIFVLALVGFGAKAGFVPFHVWLPEAHPAAPSHVSALMSGVMIKMGFYGILRIVTFLGPPAAWWGLTLAGLGLLTALVGIALALYQRDVKRVLAYSSIENMGLIGLALGAGLWGWARDLPAVAVLGMTAGLLHIWNHALMKGLLFFAAGSVLHGTGTRDMEKLGGLLKRMPWTGSVMIVGSVALAALPPLNGFISKWLLYLSLLRGGLATGDGRSLTALFAVGLLALIGGLAAVAFVRLTGMVLLGSPRSEAAQHAHEASPWLLGPMLVLVLLCLTAALVPQTVANLLARPLTQVLGRPAASALGELGAHAPLYLLGNINGWILVALGAVAWIFLAGSRKAVRAEGPTWGCGYVKPTVRMQYTGRSFAEMIAEHLLPRFLRPHTTRQAPRGLFPSKSDFGCECPDPVRVKVYEPFFHRWADWCSRLRILQQGQVNIYLVYMLLVVVLALVWVSFPRVVGDDMSEVLILLGAVLAGASGVPGLLGSRSSMSGQWLTTLLAVLGAGLGLGGVGTFWATGASEPLVLPWSLPGAEFNVAVDGLSAIFLLPIFLISLLGNVYGLAYWRQTEHPENGDKLRLFYGTLTAGMALVVVARNSILFLFGWEIMALSAFFLVTTEDHQREAREAGWIYLVATHVATLCLFALFALLRAASGSFTLAPLPAGSLTPGTATAIFVLALVGFGVKAGIMPLHVWLPSAHAISPSHVSAILSGVILKMGVYGLARTMSLLPNPPLAWGSIVLGLGVVSGILGVAFAIAQHDLKRLLAYHSIENIGIIVMGLGLALLGRSLGPAGADWVVLGLGGSLLHVWNHALFKALLFLSAGSVVHATHTRDIDHLGGLAKGMPWTALCFLVGAVAICGLPPLNGFVSEFLVYLGLFGTLGKEGGPSFAAAAFAVPALALIGALALACFVKVYGVVFLGTARSEHARHAHEAPPAMLGPMAVLVACCFMIGLAPRLLAPVLGQGVAAWAPDLTDAEARLVTLAPLGWITVMGLGLSAALLATWAGLQLRLRSRGAVKGATWGCGYLAPTPRMQYTSSSFAQMLVGLFGWALRPRTRRPRHLALFPQKSAFHSVVPETVLDEAVLPAFRFGAWLFSWFHVFQQGRIQGYLLYIFLALIVLLLWR